MAASQKAVVPPLPSTTSYPSGRSNSWVRPSRICRTRPFTGAWRCEVPMIDAPSVARACSASGRTFDGPQPNRPSAGRSSAGIVMLIREVPLGGAAGVRASGRRGLGDRLDRDRVEALDLFGLAGVGTDVAGRRAHEPAGGLLLEDVREPAGGAGTGE